MLLTIDVGNSAVKFGIYDGPTLVGAWRASTDHDRTPDEWAIHLERFLALSALTLDQVQGCIIASVVPRLTEALLLMSVKYLHEPALVVDAESDLGMPIEFPHPAEIGADRLVGAVAAVARFGAPVVVVDFGTATIFDVVSERGGYQGGVIAPGLENSLAALTAGAARLTPVELTFPPHAIGQSTVEAMQSGLMWGYISLIEGLGNRIQHDLARRCPVVATGELAPRLAPRTTLFSAVDLDLTIEGLRLVWERRQSRDHPRATDG